MTRLEIDEQQEYQTRVLVFHIEVKNNCGVPTKFSGTQEEFDIKFKPFFDSDTYGKIIGIEKEDLVEVVDENIINDKYSPFYGKSIKEIEEIIMKDEANKRYWKYL